MDIRYCEKHGYNYSAKQGCYDCAKERGRMHKPPPDPMEATPKPQTGQWTLIAPDGAIFEARSPLLCCRAEQKTRVPEQVAVDRLISELNKCDLCQDGDYEFTLGRNTPAETKVCLTCKNTIARDIK